MMFLLRKIRNTIVCHRFMMTSKTLCHAELVSASHDVETQKRVQGDIRIGHKPFCHSELGSESHKCIEEKFNLSSYHSADKMIDNHFGEVNEVRCGIFKNLKKSLAFTLAETLIVMGIIGVVAALTIPNLNSSTADKEKVAKLKKVYSNLQDAFGRAEAVYGPFDEWFQADTTNSTRSSRFSERMLEFMKTSRNCGHAVNAACMKTGNFTGALGDTISSTAAPVSADNVSAILADGTSIVFSKSTQGNMLGTIYVDIDGPNKGLFRHGVDLFRFYVSPDRGIYYSDSTDLCSSSTPGDDDSCENWVLSNGNLDYLKADSSGKCPNGKILNWTTNTSCK
ncbi:MAG: hypothetical protein DKM23_05600 [Candidatus Melainabacteria bacterium]|nr:MAG: hypothetical protein DKM23_05600 [Candidatus Melainabacteria bacterium]